MDNPKVIFLFSGKRKSGKDFITDKLLTRLGSSDAVIVRLSGPIKQQYAITHGLDYDELLSASQYKEQYRQDMITWSEDIRNKQPQYFIEKAVQMFKGPEFRVWVVSDMRRVTDLEHFTSRYPGRCVTVRVTASLEARQRRGWIHTAGVDDAESECDLDVVGQWAYTVDTSTEDEATVTNLVTNLAEHVTSQ